MMEVSSVLGEVGGRVTVLRPGMASCALNIDLIGWHNHNGSIQPPRRPIRLTALGFGQTQVVVGEWVYCVRITPP